MRAVRSRVHARFGRVDVLVGCAGIAPLRPLLAVRDRDLAACLEVNLFGALRCLRVFGELMAQRRQGRIIHLGSVAAERALPGAAAYSASKAALMSLTRSAAVELAPLGVQVLAISPGWVRSALSAGVTEAALSRVPLQRPAEPDEVAEVVRFVASCRTRYLTGVSWVVDGGLTA